MNKPNLTLNGYKQFYIEMPTYLHAEYTLQHSIQFAKYLDATRRCSRVTTQCDYSDIATRQLAFFSEPFTITNERV
jgi:hypothetical protein